VNELRALVSRLAEAFGGSVALRFGTDEDGRASAMFFGTISPITTCRKMTMASDTTKASGSMTPSLMALRIMNARCRLLGLHDAKPDRKARERTKS